MKIAILSSSLNPGSRSRVLAQEAESHLKAQGIDVDLIDLQVLPSLPLAGAAGSWDGETLADLDARLSAAQGILIAAPVYTYDLNAAVKNVAELAGGGFEDKPVGFLLAAGGMGSYMAAMSFANSLMLDFRSFILPRFVYALKDAVAGGKVVDPEVVKRVHGLADEMVRVAGALQRRP
jgi:FMN reductase